MSGSRTATLFVFAFATLLSASDLLAEPPLPAAPAQVGPTRLFLAPTARSLPHGKGTIGLTEIAAPWGEVGLTDRVSVLAGSVLPFGIVGIAPKVQLYGGRRVQAAIGAVQLFGSDDTGGVGYGVVTLGSADFAATICYGYGYGGLVDSEGSRGVLFLGAERALGRSFRIILEGYVGGAGLGMPDQTLLGGFRFSRGRWSADIGVVVPFYETGSGMPVPLLTIAWAF
jgi:hypothetical protein